jgi:ribonuclease-3
VRGTPSIEGLPVSTRREALGLAARIGWEVRNQELLWESLSHRSWCAEHPGHVSNERLEFLGDAVLGLVVTDHLFRSHRDLPEGELAKARASVVSSATLAEVADEIGLGACLLLGKGEDQSGGREKPSILADATEALIGAVYLDRGYGAARRLVMDLLAERLELAAAGPGGQDFKTRLQELCARRFELPPVYAVSEEGPDHAKRFWARVSVDGTDLGEGEGRSKKQAEQAAARRAWEVIEAAAWPSSGSLGSSEVHGET